MAFEKTVPLWGAPGIEPPESLKAGGFEPGYRPPAPFFNWFWHSVSQCLAELQGMTPDDIGAAMADLSNVPLELLKQKVEAAGISGGGSLSIATATSTDGVAYTAKAENVAELTNGMMLVIIPNMTSTSTAVTLNVNGLGDKYIRIPSSASTATLTAPRLAGYFVAGRPVVLQYDAVGGAWKTVDKQRPDAADIDGIVGVEHGGSGASTPAGARANYEAQKQVTYSTTDLTAGTSKLADGEVYLVYE